MTQTFRAASGGQIDRSKPVSFSFDGQTFSGFAGDTLASALLANGQRLFGRSFKYHRPRGVLTAGFEEPNALVELRNGARREPNSRATTIELFEGLSAQSQNRWPSLGFDLMAVNSWLSPLFGAGFYYKTFMWPSALWERLYEPLIRRAAGLGRASGLPDPDTYDKVTDHCDILVVGSGPAGLSAALSAARAGARIIVAEEDFALGGRLLADAETIDGAPADQWLARTLAELQASPNVTLLPRTCVFAAYDHGTYAAIERVNDHCATPPQFQPRQRLWRIIARQTILASGAIERPLVFGDNDRPNVMLAGAARSYARRFAVRPGNKAVVFGTHDDAATTLQALASAGVSVAAYIDPRAEPSAFVKQAAERVGARLISGVVTRALGNKAVTGVEIRHLSHQTETLPCDVLAMSGGWNPALHLTSHQGDKPQWSDALHTFIPGDCPPAMRVAGAANGEMTLAQCLASGQRAGEAAARDCGFNGMSMPVPFVALPETAAPYPLWHVSDSSGKAFVDFQNDVSASDIALAHREGYRSVEHLKRYTTLGMATDQGKTSNINGLALLAESARQTIAQTGTTRFRPPYSPVSLGALAGTHTGKNFRPTRLTAGHGWAQAQGAVFMEAGLWLRAQYFPSHPQEDWLTACNREVLAVRNQVGVADVSTLGKIDIQGKDAAAFLDKVYCNTFSTLPVGRVRYGLMLREDGFVMDDGTCARLGPEHFFMTTTTVNAVKVMNHLDFCAQTLWPELDVQMISQTEHWAQYSVAGPHARDVIQALVAEDISNAAFPYMACAEISIGSLKGRLYRISFSGEMAYEIGVPARYGDALIRAIMQAGAAYGIRPYGIEALNVMRIEKGHLGGSELSGQTTAADLGLGKMMAMKKDFIGRMLSQREALVAPDRKVLVGVQSLDPRQKFSAGAHLLEPRTALIARNDLGYVTSAGYSPTLDQHIGLALLEQGAARQGSEMLAYDSIRGRHTPVRICSPHFVDPQGSKLRG